jgi:hypothetical protein
MPRFDKGARVTMPKCPFGYIGGDRVGTVTTERWHDLKRVDYGWIDGIGHVVLSTHESHLQDSAVPTPPTKP